MVRVGRVMAAALVAVPLFVAVGPAVSSAAPIGDVSGTMVDTSLQPLAGEVSLVDGDGTVVYDTPVAADGLFSFTGVEEGSYSLRASTGGEAAQ